MNTELIQIYSRDLDRLKAEISAFQKESNLWEIKGEVKNSAGNLCLHLIGNLRTYVGMNMGHINYKRNREAEFNLKNIPSQDLLEQIEETKVIVLKSLSQMESEHFEELHREDVLGYPMSNRFFLIHLIAHFSYHLGQINYLRRILEK